MRAALVVLSILAAGCAPEGAERAQALREGWLHVGVSETPPDAEPDALGIAAGIGDGTQWERVVLPDTWDRSRRRRGTEGWYRFEISLPQTPGALQAVYLPRASLNARIHVNGVMVGQGGHFEDPTARNVFYPTYASVPHELLRPGSNRIDVRLKVSHGSLGYLEAPWFGPDAVLRPVFERRRFFSRDVTRLAHMISIVVALLSLAGGLRRPGQPSGVPWLSAGLLCFSLGSFSVLFPDLRIGDRLVEWLTWVFIILAIGLGTMGMRRMVGRRSPFQDALAMGTAIAAPLLLAMVSHRDFRIGLAILMLPVVLLVIDGAVQSLRALGGDTLRPRAPLVLLGIVIIATPIAERSFGPADDLGFQPASANMAVTAICLAWFLFSNTLRTAFDAHRLDAELAAERARVALERDRAVAVERDRMIQDMHDGTAGHLVSALSLLRSGEAEPAQLSMLLQDALDDLRTTIEALDPAETTLSGVLGVLRHPIERRLRPHGIELAWRVGEIDHVNDLDAADSGHLFRLIQESVGNAIKHARASRIELAAEPAADGASVVVSIRDDGVGGVRERPGGRGLANLARRAGELGASLSIDSGPAGTLVALALPVTRAARTAAVEASVRSREARPE